MDSKNEFVIYMGPKRLIALEGTVDGAEPRIVRFVKQDKPEGFESGLVTHLEKASASLQAIVGALRLQGASAEDISWRIVLANPKLKTFSFASAQYYQGIQRTISAHEIRAVVEQTRTVATLPLSEFVLQAIPESFVVNDVVGVRNPLGLEATRLSVQLKLFTMNFQDFKNLSRAFETAELDIAGFFPQNLTLSESVLTDQEKEEGVLLADIHEGYSELILWQRGNLIDTRILELGSLGLAEKMAQEWHIDLCDAIRVREQYGSFADNVDFKDELIPLIERNGKGHQQVHRQAFQEKFLVHGKEWLGKIVGELDRFTRHSEIIHPHYVFAGDGVPFDGFFEFFQNQFERSARLGLTRRVEAPSELSVDPSYGAALGLYRWLATRAKDQKRFLAPSGFLEKTFASARNWFAAYF